MEQPLVIPNFTDVTAEPHGVEASAPRRSTGFLHVIESPKQEPKAIITTGVYIATIVGILLVGWFGQLTFRGMAIANAVEADKVTMETRNIHRDTLQIQADVAQRLAPAQLEAAAKKMGMEYGPTPTFVTVNADQHVPATPANGTVLPQVPTTSTTTQTAPGD